MYCSPFLNHLLERARHLRFMLPKLGLQVYITCSRSHLISRIQIQLTHFLTSELLNAQGYKASNVQPDNAVGLSHTAAVLDAFNGLTICFTRSIADVGGAGVNLKVRYAAVRLHSTVVERWYSTCQVSR